MIFNRFFENIYIFSDITYHHFSWCYQWLCKALDSSPFGKLRPTILRCMNSVARRDRSKMTLDRGSAPARWPCRAAQWSWRQAKHKSSLWDGRSMSPLGARPTCSGSSACATPSSQSPQGCHPTSARRNSNSRRRTQSNRRREGCLMEIFLVQDLDLYVGFDIRLDTAYSSRTGYALFHGSMLIWHCCQRIFEWLPHETSPRSKAYSIDRYARNKPNYRHSKSFFV